MAVLSRLEPKKVFEYFEKLCAVPHGSRNTKRISDLCVSFAQELGLRWRQDEVNNVVIWKDASPGYEKAEAVILQGHIDMVCVKTEDCAKDMAREGIDLVTDGEWIWGDKTSLGGDNGIAVAMILAILADDSLPHPPLEAVFTVDEEIGMDGAFALDCSDLKGKKLVNLDSEEEGVFTVSCAGGVRLDCLLPGKQEPLSGCQTYSVTLSGLLGGHSGGDIHKGRASANQVMVRALYSAMERCPGLRLSDIHGGKFDNVICSKCEALAAVPTGQAEAFEAFIREFDAVLKNEYAGCDDGITLTCGKTTLDSALSQKTTENILSILLALPQGIQAMNVDFPGLVQTSLNLGVMAASQHFGPVLHRFPEGHDSSAGPGHPGAGRRRRVGAQQLPRLAVCQAVRPAGGRPGGLQGGYREGGRYRGHPRRAGVRPVYREDSRSGRHLHRPGAPRCPLH